MQTKNIYVFDLDGVITDPANSSVDQWCVYQIYSLLENGFFVAVNTGRSFAWVNSNLLGELRGLGGHQHFDRLYIVCEKGGESLIWSNDEFVAQPSRFALDRDAVAACKRVFDEGGADFETMFWDTTKQTMATIEKRPEADLGAFHHQQSLLVRKLEDAFSGQQVRIDGTTIATDVELPGAGKHAGAELIYEWVSERIEPHIVSFTCFGDSKSDYEMARYFSSRGRGTTFVFVGKKDVDFEESDSVHLVRTNDMYAAGTREYFLSTNT